MILSIPFSLIPLLENMASIIYVLLAIFVICFFLRKIFLSKPFKELFLKITNFLIMRLYTNSSVARIRKAIYTSNLWIGAIDEATKNTLKNCQNISHLAYLVIWLNCVFWRMKKPIYKLVMKINSVLLLPFIVRKRLTPDTTETLTDFPINDSKYFL